ncbi:type II toxin-antitoxin system TacA family antitoxin [Sinorhizobium fredii]|uniref:type II toxin-antitoxin system TacA family antitoxin n=1 Tax=Rhizobium fredii TaxID=380 RepID=UPI003519CE39
MPAPRKTRTVNLRIDPEVHDLIARAAEVCGKSITAFMTEASVYTAQEELLDQRFIGVSAEVFEAVSDKLAAPGVARDELVKLLQSKVEWMD